LYAFFIENKKNNKTKTKKNKTKQTNILILETKNQFKKKQKYGKIIASFVVSFRG